MDDYLKEALEIARAQASVRVMSEEEITSFIQKVAAGIRTVAEGEMPVELDSADMQQDARKSIKEKSVTCLECGKTFKILTKRHLAMHGMDAAAYREKWGFKKDTPLVCKALQRERRRKMKDMKLWKSVARPNSTNTRRPAGFFFYRKGICCPGTAYALPGEHDAPTSPDRHRLCPLRPKHSPKDPSHEPSCFSRTRHAR